MIADNLCPGCMSRSENLDAPCPYCGWTSAMENDPSQLRTGSELTNENGTEKYIVGRSLGQGGFGITYLAWDVNRNEKVVIKEYFPVNVAGRERGTGRVKTLTAQKTGELRNGIEDLLREAYKMLAFSNDPNIVSVRNFFRANGTAYLVMEFVNGETFEQMISDNGGRLPLAVVMNRLTPIAAALDRIHTPKFDAAGRMVREALIHRDISPDNIMLAHDGTAKLLDFGSSRSFGSNLSVFVKTGYSPIEQFISNLPQGSWTDVYSFAATIYRAITGKLPPSAIDRQNKDLLIPPSRFGVQISPQQESALMKALAPDYRQRFQTAAEFMSAFNQSPQPQADDSRINRSLVLTAIGLAISLAAVILLLYTVGETADDFSEFVTKATFLVPFAAAVGSTIFLGAFLYDVKKISEAARPQFLTDFSRLDTAFWGQVICAGVAVMITLIHADTWENDFLELDLLLYEYAWDYNSLSVIRIFIWVHAICSVYGTWLGRKILQSKI